MNRHKMLLSATLIAGLFGQQTVLADVAANVCALTPYVGACPQGCDETAPAALGGALPEIVGMAIKTAQIDCASTPYIGPLCGDGQ